MEGINRIPEEEIEASPIKLALAVDDEAGIRILNQRYLQSFGVVTQIASNGEEGLFMFDSLKELDMVISDNSMETTLKGRDMLKAMREKNSDVFLVLSSGDHFNEDVIAQMKADGINIVLKKPVTGEQLQSVLAAAGEWKAERSRLREEQENDV